MATHRVGDSYLTDDEYQEYRQRSRKGWLIMISLCLGGFVSGKLIKSYYASLDIEYIALLSIFCGVIISFITYALRNLIWFVLFISAFLAVGWVLFNIFKWLL